MSSLVRIARNSTAVFVANLLSRALGGILVIYLTRVFGAELYGIYLTIVTLVLFLQQLSDFGLYNLAVRDIARDRGSVSKRLGTIAVLKMVCALIGFCVLPAAGWLVGLPAESQPLLLLAGFSLFPNHVRDAFASGLAGLELVHLAAFIGFVTRLLSTGGSVLALALGYGLTGVFLVSTGINFLSAGVVWFLVKRAQLMGALRADWRMVRQTLSAVFPFAVTSWLGMLYYRMDILIVSGLHGNQAVGWYGAAMKPIEILLFIPVSLTTALFPFMASDFKHHLKRFWRSYEGALRLLMQISLPMAMGIAILAEPITLFLYGEEFLPVAPGLAVAASGLALSFINAPVLSVVLSSDVLPKCLPYMVVQVATKVVLTFGLVWWMGYFGACVAILIGEIGSFLWNLYYLTLVFGRRPPFGKIAFHPVLAAGGMGLVLVALGDQSLPLRILVGIVSYFALMLTTGGIGPADLEVFKSLMRLKPGQAKTEHSSPGDAGPVAGLESSSSRRNPR